MTYDLQKPLPLLDQCKEPQNHQEVRQHIKSSIGSDDPTFSNCSCTSGGRASERLTREYRTWLFASAQPAAAASICVQPGSERGFCEMAAPRRTCLWDKRPPVWFPGPPPAAGRPLYSEQCTPDLGKHREVHKMLS